MIQLVAECAMNHGDPVVRAFCEGFIPVFYDRRRRLRAPYSNADGDLILPAFPEFLRVPPKLGTTEAREDLDFRRSDHMAVICRAWTVIYANTDWVSKEVREPNPHKNKGHRYLSVDRIAELAKAPVWQVERALYWLRAAKVITYTLQFREELADGKCRSSDAALRRVSLSALERTPCTRRALEWRRRKLGARADKRKRKAARAGLAADIVREQERRAVSPPPAPPTRSPDLPPAELVEAVASELGPGALLADVLDEARRRQKA